MCTNANTHTNTIGNSIGIWIEYSDKLTKYTHIHAKIGRERERKKIWHRFVHGVRYSIYLYEACRHRHRVILPNTITNNNNNQKERCVFSVYVVNCECVRVCVHRDRHRCHHRNCRLYFLKYDFGVFCSFFFSSVCVCVFIPLCVMYSTTTTTLTWTCIVFIHPHQASRVKQLYVCASFDRSCCCYYYCN